jgi:hypothetical protein
MLPDWRIEIGRKAPQRISTLVPIKEGERFVLRGLEPLQPIRVGRIDFLSDENGSFALALSDHEDFRCHVGLLEIRSENGTGFELDVEPGKLSRERFEILRDDLQNAWANVVLDPDGSTSTSAMSTPADQLWDQRTKNAIESILAVPPTRLELLPTYTPIDRARQISTPTSTLVEARQNGRPIQALAPTPVPCTRELGFVRDVLIRLRALAARQRYFANEGSDLESRLHATIESISRCLEHPTLRVQRTDLRPTHLMRSDRRLRRVLELRSALAETSVPVVEGPGELRLGLAGLDRLYEMWVFLAILRAAAQRYGPPSTGIEDLAHRLPGDRIRLHLADQTSVDFPGGITVVFNPSIRSNPRFSWAGLELSPSPCGSSFVGLATPDVLILGPHQDGLVVDAKYRARHLIDEAAVEIHAKYSRIRRHGNGVISHVMAAHPHDSLSFRYAGYSMVPFAPGLEFPKIPWPSSHSIISVAPQPEDARYNVVPGSSKADRADQPAAPRAVDSFSFEKSERVSTTGSLLKNPDLVIVDQAWTHDELGRSRRLDLRLFAQYVGLGPKTPGYFVGFAGSGMDSFHRAAQQAGWRVEPVEEVDSIFTAAEDLMFRHNASQVLLVSGRQRLVDHVRSLCPDVEVFDDLRHVLKH